MKQYSYDVTILGKLVNSDTNAPSTSNSCKQTAEVTETQVPSKIECYEEGQTLRLSVVEAAKLEVASEFKSSYDRAE
ncbi:hypothetical protein FQR65_LT13770 [Abscondita terminalis]|nr:hypothetical protein FQR65_LT13770 [Abscondita terminalis]